MTGIAQQDTAVIITQAASTEATIPRTVSLRPIAAARPISVEKQQWSKLIGLIEQKFVAKDIGYLDDEEEVASRKIPPPSQFFSNHLYLTCPPAPTQMSELVSYLNSNCKTQWSGRVWLDQMARIYLFQPGLVQGEREFFIYLHFGL